MIPGEKVTLAQSGGPNLIACETLSHSASVRQTPSEVLWTHANGWNRAGAPSMRRSDAAPAQTVRAGEIFPCTLAARTERSGRVSDGAGLPGAGAVPAPDTRSIGSPIHCADER